MAFTAVVTASIYGVNGNDWGNVRGVSMGFPSQSIIVRPVKTNPTDNAVVMGGVTMVSIIQVLFPSISVEGSPAGQPQYYSDAAVATLITNSNV